MTEDAGARAAAESPEEISFSDEAALAEDAAGEAGEACEYTRVITKVSREM